MDQLKQLAGVLNLDDANEVVAPGEHTNARNIVFRGAPGNMRPESVVGTTLINFTRPAGTNESIGEFFDQLRNRIILFNWNSNGNHGIYQYDIKRQSVETILVVGSETDGDIFEFDLDNYICNVNILYGDATQGDELYFINSQKQPCQINIDKAINREYGIVKRSYIDVAKAPPTIPASAAYENDSSVTVNNVRKYLFKFKYRYVYKNKQKSVWSEHSETPMPQYTLVTLTGQLDPQVDADPTINARIALVLFTGDEDVDAIEIAACQNIQDSEAQSVYSDFFLIETLNKSELSIDSNDIYAWRFYNDKAYNYVDVRESILLFDYVPLEANAQELLNGSVPVYGGITEGYDKLVFAGEATASDVIPQPSQLQVRLVASQTGEEAFGSGVIHAIITGVFTFASPDIENEFFIYTTNETISYLPLVGDTNADVIAGLAASAVTAGFTVVSSDDENLYITKTGESLERTFISEVFVNPLSSLARQSVSFAYDWESRYGFGVVYEDEKGRSNGAFTSPEMVAQTYYGTGFLPAIDIEITSRPPLWARSYRFVRTKNLTKEKSFYWISDRTYKDAEYAYISIENLAAYIVENPSAQHLSYGFIPGSRIRFIQNLSYSSKPVLSGKDYEIISYVTNPTVEALDLDGRFLKIRLPDFDANFNFGTEEMSTYFINIYTPAKSVEGGLDFYYEFAERYAIGNPGTDTAYHQGQLQNQTSDLSQPATFQFLQGDMYYRNRTITAGNVLSFKVNDGQTMNLNYVPGAVQDSVSFVDPQYVVNPNIIQQTANGTNFAITSTNSMALTMVSGTKTFLVKGSYVVAATADTFVTVRILLTGSSGYSSTSANNASAQIAMVAGGQYTIPFQKVINMSTVPPNGPKLIIYLYSSQLTNPSLTVISGEFTITEPGDVYAASMMDANYSDFYPSAVNSNGRAWVIDENASQVYNPALIRHGLAYQINTNINQTNRFYPDNTDEVDAGKGDIERLRVIERIMRIYQTRGVGQVGIYNKFIQDSSGTSLLTTSDTIITKNNIQYYRGQYGLCGYPTALVKGPDVDYFTDAITGSQIRLSADGMTVISDLYKGQYTLRDLIVQYNKEWLRQSNGAKAKIIGYYDVREEQFITILQGGIEGPPGTDLTWTDGIVGLDYEIEFLNNPTPGYTVEIALVGSLGATGTGSYTIQEGDGIGELIQGLKDSINALGPFVANSIDGYSFEVSRSGGGVMNSGTATMEWTGTSEEPPTIPSYAFSFNEKRNAYVCFYDYAPDMITCADETTYSSLNGAFYIHNNTSVYCSFYGVQYYPSITLVFNDKEPIKKTFNAIGYQANQYWESRTNGDITTSQPNDQTNLPQISQLKSVDYTIFEGQYNAGFLFDTNSRSNAVEGLNEGDFLKGSWIQVKLTYNGAGYAWIYMPFVTWSVSQRNF